MENRQENKPDQEHQYFEPPMRQQVECHDITCTDDGIEQVGSHIHDKNESPRAQHSVGLHLRYNIEIVFVHLPIVPGIDDKSSHGEGCGDGKDDYFKDF